MGGGVAIAAFAALAATMVIAAPSGAAGTEKVYETHFQADCVIAPGVLNEREPINVSIRGEGPERVNEGEQFALRHETLTLTSSLKLAEEFFDIGAREVRGSLLDALLDAENGQPAQLNLAQPPEFPTGIPYRAKVEREKPIVITVPSGEAGFTSPPVKAEAHPGKPLSLTLDTAPGFKEREAGSYEETQSGIQLTMEGLNEVGEHVLGPLRISCTAPAGVVVANPTIGEREFCNGDGPLIRSVEPGEGPTTGGTTVHITYVGPANVNGNATVEAVRFGSHNSPSFSGGEGSVTAVTPPGEGTVPVELVLRCQPAESPGRFTYTHIERVEYTDFPANGSLMINKLGQTILLPEGSRFHGVGQLAPETGAGSVTGRFEVPPFTASVKLFSTLPVSLGLTMTQTQQANGVVSAAETPKGDVVLKLPASFNVGVTSIGLLGLKIPTACTAREPLSLSLTDTLTDQELLRGPWHFSGTTSLSRFRCEGGFLGEIFGHLLSALLSGPENAYTLGIA
jgi:hypothetical protein